MLHTLPSTLALSLAFLLGLVSLASAQCVNVGGVNNVPIPGLNCASEPSVTVSGLVVLPKP